MRTNWNSNKVVDCEMDNDGTLKRGYLIGERRLQNLLGPPDLEVLLKE
jgi:hypothetical protein